MAHFSRLIAACALLVVVALPTRAEMIPWWASSSANLSTCGTGSPNVTCALSKEATFDLIVANDGAIDCYHTVTGPFTSSTYTYYQARGSTGACTSLIKYINAYKKTDGSIACDTEVVGSPCYVPPPEPECGNAGEGYLQGIRATTSAAAQAVIGTCYNGCAVTSSRAAAPGMDKNPDGTFSFLFYIEAGGGTCSPGGGDPEPPVPPAAEPTGEICATSAAGVQYCNGPYGENCGYVNGKYTCLGKTDPDECWVHTDGGRLCGESAPVPPVPDSGTAGVRATATDTVSQQSGTTAGNTYNYYNSTVVAGSARDPGTSGANPNRPNSTDPSTGTGGSGEYPEPSTGTASGGESCAAAPTCTHDDPVQCAQLMQIWRSRCVDVVESEVLAAFGATQAEIDGDLSAGIAPIDIGSWSSSGQMIGSTCPAPVSISVMGRTMSLDIWQRGCDMALLFAPFVLAMGYFAGGMLLMRGGV